MSGEVQETKSVAKTAPKAEKASDEKRGAWVVFDDAGHAVIVESSEIKAFRAAAPSRGRVGFWAYGAQLADVVKTLVPVTRS